MFVQSQCLSWQPHGLGAAHLGLESKILSADPQTGAATLLLRFPPGWSRSAPHSIAAMEELYVLDGELSINGQSFVHHTYTCMPPLWPREQISSGRGAVAIAMYSAHPEVRTTRPHAGTSRSDLHVPRINAYEKGLDSWTQNPHTRFLVGTGVQTLRKDPDSGEITILYAALPFRYMEKRWTHTHVQEMYVLAGEYSINDVGVMRPGAYAWWEPQRLHGPYGSLTGFMMLIRSCGGPLENVIPEERIAVDFAAPYRPVLPPGLASVAAEAPPARNW
jgi:hypothetical protein